MSDEDDFFGGGSKAASFNGRPVIKHGGIVDRIGKRVQKREYTTDGSLGALKFYPGTTDPIWQKPITLLTDVRDPAIPNDDGRRTIYFEGAKRKALMDAMRAVGHRGDPVLGDWMALEYYADEPGRGASPKKLYRGEYAVNPNPQARGQFYVPADADPASFTQPVAVIPPQSQTVPAYAPGQPAFGNPNQPAAQTWDQQVAQGGPAPAFAQATPAAAPAANWPPAGSAPVQETQPQPVAAGAGGPVALERPWG
jgi:hypothetical protein